MAQNHTIQSVFNIDEENLQMIRNSTSKKIKRKKRKEDTLLPTILVEVYCWGPQGQEKKKSDKGRKTD